MHFSQVINLFASCQISNHDIDLFKIGVSLTFAGKAACILLIAACGTTIGNISLLQVMAVKSLSVIVGNERIIGFR